MSRTTAFADTAKDGNLMADTFSTGEINEVTLIITVNLELSCCVTDWTGFKFWLHKGHEMLKHRF